MAFDLSCYEQNTNNFYPDVREKESRVKHLNCLKEKNIVETSFGKIKIARLKVVAAT